MLFIQNDFYTLLFVSFFTGGEYRYEGKFVLFCRYAIETIPPTPGTLFSPGAFIPSDKFLSLQFKTSKDNTLWERITRIEIMDIYCLLVYSVTNDRNGKENTEETEGISSRMRSLFDVTTLEMARKTRKKQKEYPAGCVYCSMSQR